MCELTEGRNPTCDTPGGSRSAYMYSVRDSAGLTNYDAGPTIVDGEVTALSLKPGKYAYKFTVEAETIEANCKSIGDAVKSSTANEHTTVIKLAGNSAADIDTAARLIKGRVAVILELNDGTHELFHYENGGKVTRERNPGTAFDDMNGSTLTIVSRQVGTEVKISSVILNALLEP